jgi:NAD(P)-dependent dehydrogenase (short-subunit alcohol dehydrogenase family)
VFADLALRPEAESLINRFSEKAIFVVTDVTSWIALQALFDRAVRKFGQVDVVCPGAGLFEPSFSNFWSPPGTESSRDRSDGDRYKTVDVNFTHPVRLTQMAISHFLSQNPRGYFLDTSQTGSLKLSLQLGANSSTAFGSLFLVDVALRGVVLTFSILSTIYL